MATGPDGVSISTPSGTQANTSLASPILIPRLTALLAVEATEVHDGSDSSETAAAARSR